MIVVVTGSRSYGKVDPQTTQALRMEFITTIEKLDPDHVFQGGAYGPDVWAKKAFPEIETEFNPIMHQNSTVARSLFARNLFMINSAIREDSEVVVVACWDGKSTGTAHAINYAIEMDVPVVYVDKGGDQVWMK